MKIDNEMRFPHPVLWAETSDYLNSSFLVDLTLSETPATGAVQVKFEAKVTEPAIESLLAAGLAKMGFSVVCLDTYFNELVEVPSSGGEIPIQSGNLRGQVTFRPLLWAATDIVGLDAPNVHAEFGGAHLAFQKGAILAIGDEQLVNIGADKLARIASIFDLALSEDVAENRIAVNLDAEKIEILANKNTLERIHNMRNTVVGKSLLLNAVYLPVVMHALKAIADDPAFYEGRRWHRVFTAKLDFLSLNPKNAQPLEAAQTVLKSPFSRLETVELK